VRACGLYIGHKKRLRELEINIQRTSSPNKSKNENVNGFSRFVRTYIMYTTYIIIRFKMKRVSLCLDGG